ncbi:MAG: hypothetical protein ACREHF_01700 [Rhizomicrobium sp.]
MGDRLALYRALLRHLKALDYRFYTMSHYLDALSRGNTFVEPVCLLRIDIDSDPGGAARMFEIDREEGVRATYFFRLSTLDARLASRIAGYGREVGYHYEEIATAVRRLGLAHPNEIEAHMDAIRAAFRSNVIHFRERSGIAPRVVAAHGDFLNRRLGTTNRHLLTPALRAELGIVADAYDPELHDRLAARFSDRPAPLWWYPADPMQALASRPPTVSILVHPRQWVCNPLENANRAFTRLTHEIAWQIRR